MLKSDVLALDIGFGYSNAALNSEIVRIPSVVCPAREIDFASGVGSDRGTKKIVIAARGTQSFVGEYALLQGQFREPLLDRSRTETSEYQTLFYALLSELTEPNEPCEISVVTGLPMAHYSDRQSVIDLLKDSHRFVRDPIPTDVAEKAAPLKIHEVNVKNVICAVQHFGSVYNVALNGAGEPTGTVARERVGVIDVGTYTTGFVYSDRLEFIQDKSTSINDGMARVHTEVQKAIYDRWGQQLTLHETDLVIRRGYLKVNRVNTSIADILQVPLDNLVQGITRMAVSLWGKGSELDRLLLVGGGAYSLREAISHLYVPCDTVERPELANILGLAKFGLFLRNEGLL